MKVAELETVFRALEDAGARYIVVGGLAVNAHGYVRLTNDLDLVLRLDPDNILRAFHALAPLGFRPRVPVTAEQFADASQRASWIRDKHMKVLNLYSDAYPALSIDLFVEEPFDFESECARALRADFAPGLEVLFVSIPTLIEMKTAAGRARDRDDIEHLRSILEDLNDHDEAD